MFLGIFSPFDAKLAKRQNRIMFNVMKINGLNNETSLQRVTFLLFKPSSLRYEFLSTLKGVHHI